MLCHRLATATAFARGATTLPLTVSVADAPQASNEARHL
jgi:hypothetical protein